MGGQIGHLSNIKPPFSSSHLSSSIAIVLSFGLGFRSCAFAFLNGIFYKDKSPPLQRTTCLLFLGNNYSTCLLWHRLLEYLLYITWDGGINYARRRLRPKSESLSGCCVQISVKFLDCRMIPMATFVAELGMMSPACPLMRATSRQKKPYRIF